ncbi:hypothetical protein [Leifsonia poae]|uniref:hypothetical protein n=1 Tax=Leifsonia poae TaxID=110933 RepID=UPI001CBA73E0|nr:hypothetical protein [Leifsonia poae]
MTAGIKTIAQKLQVKPGDAVSILGGTAQERALIGVLPDGASQTALGDGAVALAFVHSRAELLERFADELPVLSRARAVWYLYPKGGRADVNRDTIMREAGAFGWRAISNIAIDGAWSAVRVRPLVDGEAALG